MRNKVLFCATVDYHFKAFHLPYFRWFKDQGWEIHVAAKGSMDLPFVDRKFNLSIERSPFKIGNLQAYNKLKSIIDGNQYQIIHCHTPMGGMLARLAAREARKHGTKVIYTAHGFHFCKGAPWKNWLVYYPIEKWMAHYTDCLITINQEDYQLASKHRFKAGQIQHVHGVGVDTERFKPIGKLQKLEMREKWGYRSDDFLMFYAAEFNRNKNQQFLIEAFAILKDDVPNARLLLAGEGPLLESCKELAIRLDVEKRIDFLGYRKDLETILPMCDIAVASSLREGLPVNIMEAMACGLPVVATVNRGHSELVRNNENGWIVDQDNTNEMAILVNKLAQNKKLRIRLGMEGRKLMERKYAVHHVLREKNHIYSAFVEGMEGIKWATQ